MACPTRESAAIDKVPAVHDGSKRTTAPFGAVASLAITNQIPLPLRRQRVLKLWCYSITVSAAKPYVDSLAGGTTGSVPDYNCMSTRPSPNYASSCGAKA
jgi:hypothetical protein